MQFPLSLVQCLSTDYFIAAFEIYRSDRLKSYNHTLPQRKQDDFYRFYSDR